MGAAPAPENGNSGNGNADNSNDQTSAARKATIVVKLPARARLTINGIPTNTTSSKRVFRSPALQRGKVYSYTLKASLRRNGQTVTARKRVSVQAGRVTTVSFPLKGKRKSPEQRVANRS
jgi:uncharacterized protein (TIGR03000 family)